MAIVIDLYDEETLYDLQESFLENLQRRNQESERCFHSRHGAKKDLNNHSTFMKYIYRCGRQTKEQERQEYMARV